VDKSRKYVGLDQDEYGGMTPIGTVIRDAWVFDLLPQGETCAGWDADRMQVLYDQVTEAWMPYGHLASKLPPALKDRHQAIFDEALRRARELGWSPELGEED
jgi:hypothetical protein